MEVLSLLVWLIVALVTASIAAKKNRSFIGWLIIGLILPIVGFILILVLPEGQPVKVKPKVKKKMAPPVEMKEEEPAPEFKAEPVPETEVVKEPEVEKEMPWRQDN